MSRSRMLREMPAEELTYHLAMDRLDSGQSPNDWQSEEDMRAEILNLRMAGPVDG